MTIRLAFTSALSNEKGSSKANRAYNFKRGDEGVMTDKDNYNYVTCRKTSNK